MRYRRIRVGGADYFFTVVTEGRRPLFASRANVMLLEEAVARVRSRHPFELVAQVVLPDHLHAMWRLPEGDADFSVRWRLIKERFTRKFIQINGAPATDARRRARGEQAVWQRRFWEHLIRDDGDFNRHLDYIHLNPVHPGIARSAKDWPHSTFQEWVARGAYDSTWGSNEMPALPAWALGYE